MVTAKINYSWEYESKEIREKQNRQKWRIEKIRGIKNVSGNRTGVQSPLTNQPNLTT